MLELVVTLSVVAGFLVLTVLAGFLIAVMRSLHRSAGYFGRVAFGVRAIETHTGEIGPAVTRINRALEEIAGALPAIAERAERRS